MTAPAADGWRAWWGSLNEPDLLVSEIVGPRAIADLVACRLDTPAVQRRSAAGISPITDLTALRVLLATTRRARSLSELSTVLRCSRTSVKRAAGICNEARAAQLDGPLLMPNPQWRPAATKLVAVELKKTAWTRAFQQARAYREWAHCSWVILGDRPVSEARAAAERLGIGLGFLTSDGTVEVVRAPSLMRHKRNNTLTVWAGEQVLARCET